MQNIIIMFLNKEIYRDMLTDDEYDSIRNAFRRFVSEANKFPILDVNGENGVASFDMRQIVGIVAVNKK